MTTKLIEGLTEVINIAFGADKLRIQPQTRDWCRLPYPLHPKGCKNYGKKPGCPPTAPALGDFFDLTHSVGFTIIKFDIEKYIIRRRETYPDLTDRQARCCICWQGAVRKILKAAVGGILAQNEALIWTDCPEAMGLNVLRTLNLIGIPAKKNPKQFVYKVAMLGYRKSRGEQ